MEKQEDSPEAEVGDLFVTKLVDGVWEGRIRMCTFGPIFTWIWILLFSQQKSLVPI